MIHLISTLNGSVVFDDLLFYSFRAKWWEFDASSTFSLFCQKFSFKFNLSFQLIRFVLNKSEAIEHVCEDFGAQVSFIKTNVFFWPLPNKPKWTLNTVQTIRSSICFLQFRFFQYFIRCRFFVLHCNEKFWCEWWI